MVRVSPVGMAPAPQARASSTRETRSRLRTSPQEKERRRILRLDTDRSRAILTGPGLVLPHPRAHDRLFVMGPLAEIAPDWRHPASGETAAALAAKATIGRDARPV